MKIHYLMQYYIGLLFLSTVSFVSAQELYFQTLTEENVLDKQAVLSITQDSNNKLWFAGGDNIFYYDSGRIINVHQSDSSWNRIAYVTKLAITPSDQLFIASTSGIDVYDITKRELLPRLILPAGILPTDILDLTFYDNRMFIGSRKGLHYVDCRKKPYKITTLIKDTTISTVAPITRNTILYVDLTKGMINRMQLQENNKPTFSSFLEAPILKSPEDMVTSIFVDHDQIWIGTKTRGLFFYNSSKKTIQHFEENNSDLLSNNVRKIIKGRDGNIWIGTLKGLSIYTSSGTFRNYRHNSLIPHTLSQNSIYDILIDRQHITWIGTYFGGLNMNYPKSVSMQVFSSRNAPPYQLSSDIIGGLAVTDQGYWIATEENGLNFLDKSTKQITVFPDYTRSNLVKSVYSRDNKLYIAQYAGGYSVVDIVKKSVTHQNLHEAILNSRNNVYSIHADANHTIYLGTNVGLFQTENPTSPIKPILSIPQAVIENIKEDINGNIYVHTLGQLFIKKPNQADFSPINKLKNLSIRDFYLQNDNIYLSVEDQVYCLKRNGQLTVVFKSPYGIIGSLLYTAGGKIWMTSKKGLIYHDLNLKYTNLLTTEDGLPRNDLNEARLYIDKQQLLITTKDGLVSFPISSISFNKTVPEIFLSEIKANDSLLQKERILQLINNQPHKIDLDYDENFLTFRFSNSNLIHPSKNKYRYILEGFDRTWKETSSPSIEFSNLSPGKYKLIVYTSNNDGVWSAPLITNITIHPPFYRSWWAYIIYGLIILFAVHLFIKFIVERELLINTEKEHKKKIQFFTQISHEIRTPLTLITAPLDDIIAETVELTDTHQKIKRIRKNANKLLAVINELLDFKKWDEGKHSLHKTQVELSPYLEDTFYLLNDLAQTKNLNYYIRRLDQTGLYLLDTQQFDKVMFNLLSNAIKYTPEHGTIFLDVIQQNKKIEIHIVDNGIGVAQENQFKIFEEYYREESVDDTIGTGIGLALTKEIVEQHNGHIVCQPFSENGQEWTAFSIYLEVQQSDSNPPLHEAKSNYPEIPSPQKNTAAVLQGETILIVEDNVEMAEVIAQIFEESFQVLLARNGEEGLLLAKQYIPDIILSDMMMPKMSGLEFCQAIKTDTLTSHIPFILLTASTDQGLHTDVLENGANLYLTKPFEKKQLYLSVYNLLAISKDTRKEFVIKKSSLGNPYDEEFINTLNNLIENNLTENTFGVQAISKAMGMSAPVLYKKLKAITDLSLNNYVKMYRLNRAKELLKSPTLNISEVAYAVGFSDRKYFSKEFKKAFGEAPSNYVSQNNN